MDQYRVRTEFNFRKTFGQMSKVIAAGVALGAKAMAITDPNTFGHISFFKYVKKAGMLPILGIELIVKKNLTDVDKRTCLFYACTSEGLSELYGWSTLADTQGGAITYDDVVEMTDGIVKVAATCVADEIMTSVDFIEVNPISSIIRKRAMELSQKYGVRLLPTSDTCYPAKENRSTAQLLGIQMKPTPQWMLSEKESKFYMRDLPANAWDSHAILRARCEGVELVQADNIHHPMDLLKACREAIPHKVKKWTKEYEERLVMELETIHSKKFEDYFAMLSGMCVYAKQHMLVGPARGSAAGSLVCFLLNITEIDPIVHDLMFERFIDETRYDFPDIDLDFPDEKREMVFDYLRNFYGAENVAHIGTVSRLKAKSAIGEIAKRLDIPPWETDAVKSAMIERSGGDARAAMCIMDTFNSSDVARELLVKYPAMAEAGNIEDHAWHSGKHAAGALVCNKPVRTYCTVSSEGTAQLDKKDAEAINLMKVDVLGLRTLSVIEAAGVDVHRIPLDDKLAFDVLNKHRFSGIFQFEGPALQSVTKQIGVHHFEDIVAITSLARPGPLHSGGATSFINRKNGKEEVEKIHPIFDRLTAKTQGMVLYQEQVMQLLRQVGGMEWADVQLLRRAMSKSLGLEFFEQFYERFLEGARKNKVDDKATRKMWELMIHFGSYGFNRSHAVAYALISYWCAWLKAHHPLEFACASLMHAKDEEQAKRVLREIVNEGVIKYIPFSAEHSDVNWSIWNGSILGGLTAVKVIGEKTAKAIVAARHAGKLTPAQQSKLDAPELMYADLFPAERMYGDYYSDPDAHGIRGQVTYIKDITSSCDGSFAIIAKMNTKDIRDMNETQSLARRNGVVMKRNNLFLNLELEDDTDKIIGTIGRFDYVRLGKQILDAPTDSWWIFRGDVRRGWRKIYIKKYKRLS